MLRGCLCVFLIIAIIYTPYAQAANEEGESTNPVWQTSPLWQPSDGNYSDLLTSGEEIMHYICGWNQNQTVRGDCPQDDNVAPRERWYRISTDSIGDLIDIKITNYDIPHKVDISVSGCETNAFDRKLVHCKHLGDNYGDEDFSARLIPIVSNEYWIYLEAWDEEKMGRDQGGDQTLVGIEISEVHDSNGDETNPTVLNSTNPVYQRSVCEVGCDDAGKLDPVDVFVVEGFQGDFMKIAFGSRENDYAGHLDLAVFYTFELDWYNSSHERRQFYLDDSYHYYNDRGGVNEEGVSELLYTFHTSGKFYIWFLALETDFDAWESGARAESFTIELTYFSSEARNITADRDGDGLPDLEEIRCGSDFRVSLNTSADYDKDQECDLFDNDDDGDGVLDDEDSCRLSPLVSTYPLTNDYDNDGCLDIEDKDIDNDGIFGKTDDCSHGVIGNGSYDPLIDRDGDGCHDFESINSTENIYGEDFDDDNDEVLDSDDACKTTSSTLYDVSTWVDNDMDGCHDLSEDTNDDDDAYLDDNDQCPNIAGNSSLGGKKGCIDSDGDGYEDQSDDCWDLIGMSYLDRFGCPDDDLDGYSNEDILWTSKDGADAFPKNELQWSDSDGDGYGDNPNDEQGDDCPNIAGKSFLGDKKGCIDSDSDGLSDEDDLCEEDSENYCWGAVFENPKILFHAKGGDVIPTFVLIFAVICLHRVLFKRPPDY